MERVRRRLAFVALAVCLTLATGTVGFVLIEDYPVFDAFYMTLITVTTVGYSEIRGLSTAGRVFNSALLLSGITVIFLSIGAMTQTVIELELNQYFGRRRMKSMIDKLEGHIILCGFGRVGWGAAAELQQSGTPFVVIDNQEDRVERAMQAGMLAVLADASRDEVLRDVGIERAKGLIATLASDADNLFLIMTARTLNPSLQLSARVAEETSEPKMRRAGATFVFAPYGSTGHRMAQALLRPHVLQFLDYTMQRTAGLEAGIEQVRVEETCAYCGGTIEDLQLRRETGVILLAIRRASGQMLFNPPPDVRLAGGDYLIVMGEPAGLRRLEQMLMGAAK